MNKELIENYLEEKNLNDYYKIKVFEENNSVYLNIEGFIFVVEDEDAFSIYYVGDDFEGDDYEEMDDDLERFVKRLERQMYKDFYVHDIF